MSIYMCLQKLNKNFIIKLCKDSVNNQKRLLSLGIVGAPTSAGQCKSGVELGPKYLRLAGLVKQIQDLGHNVIDYGDIPVKTSNHSTNNQTNHLIKNELEVQEMCSQLWSLVTKVVRDDRIPITLGGDHSIAMASIGANATHHTVNSNDDICVLWVDAHADINTVSTTRSGHLHGMPLSFLIHQIKHVFNNPNDKCLNFKSCIDAKNIAVIGLRDVESSEVNIIKKLNITHYSMQDIDRIGILETMARTLDQINPRLDKRIHVSFDVDAIDPSVAPSTGTPVPAGLTLREAFCIGEEIFKTNKLCGLDFVEVNPQIGDQNDVNNTIDCALNVILSFMGKSRINNYIKSCKN